MSGPGLPAQVYEITARDRMLQGVIHLDGSKSISNRALIIRALCRQPFQLTGLSTSDDTRALQRLLMSADTVLDAGAAGTTFRFLTAYLAFNGFGGILTGSARMKERPIGPLVQALSQLGANITYVEKEGYPPLQFHPAAALSGQEQIALPANISSQFISAILMIAPQLSSGLRLRLDGELVSRPYLQMTLDIMGYFGITHRWDGDLISIPKQDYQARDFIVEADWSAASYYYSLAALSSAADITLTGLSRDSLQGDSIIVRLMQHFGVTSTFGANQVRLQKKPGEAIRGEFEADFLECPDLAQTLITVCAATGTPGRFKGLKTLFIKETDRVKAMQTELARIGVQFLIEPGTEHDPVFSINGKPQWSVVPTFATYHDHRMAMALAPLALLHPVRIADPGVVSKSYGNYWDDLRKLGINYAMV